jgi:hypothetical protein
MPVIGDSEMKTLHDRSARRSRRVLASMLELPDPVARGLERFAELTRRILVWEATGWIVTALLGAFTLLALADRCFLIEDGTRRFFASAAYAGVLGLGYWLLRAALRRRNPTDVALALEAQAPHAALQERISTTVELASRSNSGEGLSAAMVERVADEAAQCIQVLNIDSLPNRNGMRRALRIGAALLALLVLLCIPSRLQMRTAYCRAFFPWANLQRPGSTAIDVLTGSTRVVDGETVDVQIHTTGDAVSEAYLETRQANGSWQEVRMEGDASAGRFNLALGPLHEKMEYRARAGDGRSAAYDIDVLPRPEIAGLKITIHQPTYTELPAQTFERLNGDISVLHGSHVELAVDANIKLDAALLEFPDDRRVSMAVQDKGASVAFDITQDTTYRVRLRSIDGVGNPDAPLFSIHALPDLPPQVTVIKPQSDETVDANSVLPFEAKAEDDYGITSMRIVVQSEEQHEPIVFPLEKPAESGKVWLVTQPWDLAGLALNSTQTISYCVEATDTNGSVGRSDERRLHLAGGRKRQMNQLLLRLDEAQKLLISAHNQFGRAAQDVEEMRLVFRSDDSDFQSADRLLLSETLNRIARDVRSAGSSVERGLPDSEAGALHTLLEALNGSLTRFADTSIRPLHRAALRAKSPEPQAIRAGLDTIAELLPSTAKELDEIHEALTAAHRYAAATLLEARAIEINETQAHITPILVGAAGWTPKGAAFPGLLAEYYSGSHFTTVTARTVEPGLVLNPKKAGAIGPEGVSVRWTGQVLAPKTGLYVFHTAEEGLRLSLDGKMALDQWSTQIIDDSDKNFAAVGDWQPGPAPGQSYKDEFRYSAAGTGTRTATWSFTGLTPGRYRVSATWTPHPNRATDAPYTILDGATPVGSAHINQQAAPTDFTDGRVPWKELCAPVRISGTALTVRLTDQANQYVIADAIRIERVEAHGVAHNEIGVELTEGWHDFVFEVHRTDARENINLTCSGPGLSNAPIPPERFRSIGAPAAVPADGRVKAAMGKGASDSAVKHALVRLQNMVELSRTLPPELARIADFPPKPEEQGKKEGADWSALLATQTLPLDAIHAAEPAAAMPLLQWGDQCGAWVNIYKAVRERYRQAMLQFSTKLANNAFKISAEVRQLQHDAAAAEKAFNDLLAASKQPADARRDMAMAKADATVRALAEDLRTQAAEVAAELKEAATDVKRPIDERRALQSLEQRAESVARGAATELERRLSEAKSPDALAKTEQNRPNFATDAQALQQQAAELSAMAEREERAVNLRDEVKHEADDIAAAHDALMKAPSGEAAATQQHAAAELKQETAELQDAIQAAANAVNPGLLGQTAQLAQNPNLPHAEDLLQKRANETLAGIKKDAPTEEAEKKARTDTAAELDKLAKVANDTTAALNKELGALAQAWNGDPAKPLNDAANEVQEAGKALAQIPADKPTPGSDPNLNNAATHAEKAREKAEQTADRLALDAEALREHNAPPEQRAQADDLDRLAAAIRHEAFAKLDPAADLLDSARREPSQEVRLPKVMGEDAKASEDELRKLAQLAGEVMAGDPNVRKQAHDKLEKELQADALTENVDGALKTAEALDKMSGELHKDAEQQTADAQGKTDPTKAADAKNAPADLKSSDAKLNAEQEALAKALGLDPKAAAANADQQALAQRVNELAKDLRGEAEHDRQMADAIDRANGMEERAREKLKTGGAELAKEMQQAGAEAAQLAKTAPPLAGPLGEAQKALDQSGNNVGDAAKKSDSEQLPKLAEELDKAAQGLEKPVTDLANTLGQPDDKNTQNEQKIGSEARDAAGKAADLADELRRAQRAEDIARENEHADSGTRAQLEAEVRDAIAAMEKIPAESGTNAEELAALGKEAAEAAAGEAKHQQESGGGKPEAGAPNANNEKGGKPGDPAAPHSGSGAASLEHASQHARGSAEKMEQMAAQMEKLARSMSGGKAPAMAATPGDADNASETPVADAMKALAAAEAAQDTGDSAEAAQMKAKAAQLLDQAAEAARGQASGMQTAGNAEAQAMAMAEKGQTGKGKQPGKPGKEPGSGKAQSTAANSGQKSGSNAQGTPAAATLAPLSRTPPQGIPIDAATWNRLPDDLRRDLLNAAGGQFPAEYEMSIRRYFKNVATIQQEKP